MRSFAKRPKPSLFGDLSGPAAQPSCKAAASSTSTVLTLLQFLSLAPLLTNSPIRQDLLPCAAFHRDEATTMKAWRWKGCA